MNGSTGEPSTSSSVDYDIQAHQNYWHPEALFGLCYEYLQPGDRLLDIGIGTGLEAEPFAKAGLQIFGLDSSAEMLSICRAKQLASELIQHDLAVIPWPYPDGAFDHIVACGVLHFLPDLDPVFHEASRLLSSNGIFAFTTKAPARGGSSPFITELIQDTPLFLHQPEYLERLMADFHFTLRKEMHLLVRTWRETEDIFLAFVTQKSGG